MVPSLPLVLKTPPIFSDARADCVAARLACRVGVRRGFHQAQTKQRRGRPEDYVVGGKRAGKVRLRQRASRSVGTARDGVEVVDSAVECAAGSLDKAGFEHRTIRSNKGRNRVSRAIQRGQRYLRIRNRVLRTEKARAGASDCGLSMALRTAIPVEGWTKTRSRFAGDAAGNRIDFLKTKLSLVEKSLLIRVEGWIKTSRRRRTRARTRIVLRVNRRRSR